ncbi:MAG: class I SAM-dependent methyltransferase [Actinobacteria bacterium]|jgi:ubiquinone/menaquinone biosynthesis C-methylase UbiE|nr:MAG: class I SAM-dependent methyltransferase [Actinomycetota bacterium]
MADWDELAGRFDEAFFADPMYSRMLAAMVERVPDREGIRALDLGCGTGNLIALLLERSPSMRITGVDPSAGMREVSAERFRDRPDVKITAGDALDIPFPDASFNLLVSSLALHHVPPDLKPSCAQELARVLEPGGIFIHADPFCGVPGAPDEPPWWRDVIERMVAKAVYSLEHGAWNMMLGELRAIPLVLRGEGEYLIMAEEWEMVLHDAGFTGFEVIDIPPVDLYKIISCTLRRAGRASAE